jgi:hypothetical protein
MRIRIYDTEGKLRYGRSEDDQRNRFVSEVYRNAKLRFLIDTRGDSFRVLCYVRAVESEGQRSEQFYVDMVSDTPVELSEFKREAVKTLRKVFHEIDLSNPTTDVFEYLDADMDASQLLPEDDLHAVRSLADQGETLDFGAGDQRAALSVAKSLGGIPAKVVIADAGRTEYYDDAEVVLDTGFDGEGIAASKKTTEKIKQYLERQSKSAAEKKIADIEKQAKELKEIKREEGLSDSEVDKPLRNVLKTQFPGTFRSKKKEETGAEKRTRKETQTTRSKKTKPETTTKPADVSSDGDDSEKGGFVSSVPTKALGGVLIIGIIGLLVAGVAVYGPPLSELMDGGGNGDGAETGGGNESNTDGGDGNSGGNDDPIEFGEVLINGEEWGDYEVTDETTLRVSGELNNADDKEVNGSLADGTSVISDTQSTSSGFELSFEQGEVREDIGYDDYDGDSGLTLSLSAENVAEPMEATVDWDTRLPPELILNTDSVNETNVNNNTTTVRFTVRNRGNRTGSWEVSLNNGTSAVNTTTIEGLGGNSKRNESLSVSQSLSEIEIVCSPEQESEDATCSDSFPYSDF